MYNQPVLVNLATAFCRGFIALHCACFPSKHCLTGGVVCNGVVMVIVN